MGILHNQKSTHPKFKVSAMQRAFRPEDFHPIKVIGRGSIGKVTLVQEKASGSYYALKSIRKQEIPTERQKSLARQERDLLTSAILQSSSPFLVHIYASFQTSSHLYLLLEYHPGGDFATLLSTHYKLDEQAARFYAAEVVLGLEALRSLQIVYRDLKPENVLVDRNGHLVLIDFGLSKSLEGGITKTFCGTAEYLAPEVLLGQPYGFAVDLWSLGTMLFEMLTGSPPYWAESSSVMYGNIVSAGPIDFPPYLSPSSIDLIKGVNESKLNTCTTLPISFLNGSPGPG